MVEPLPTGWDVVSCFVVFFFRCRIQTSGFCVKRSQTQQHVIAPPSSNRIHTPRKGSIAGGLASQTESRGRETGQELSLCAPLKGKTPAGTYTRARTHTHANPHSHAHLPLCLFPLILPGNHHIQSNECLTLLIHNWTDGGCSGKGV